MQTEDPGVCIAVVLCAWPLTRWFHEKRSQMRRSSTAIEPQWEGPTGASGPLDAILVVRTLATMRGRIRQREWLIKSRWRETSRAAGLSLSHKSPSKFVLRPAGSHATAIRVFRAYQLLH